MTNRASGRDWNQDLGSTALSPFSTPNEAEMRYPGQALPKLQVHYEKEIVLSLSLGVVCYAAVAS